MNTNEVFLRDFYKRAIVAGLRSGELSRASATLEYVRPFLEDGTFSAQDAAELDAVRDEVYGPVVVPVVEKTQEE